MIVNYQRRGRTNIEVNPQRYTPEEILRLTRLGRELRLTDQILAFDMDTLSIVDTGPAPAWTTLDGDAISFAMDQMPAPTDKFGVMVWLGTNAHEVGHSLFSPRRHSALMERVVEGDRTFLPGLAQLCNIAEDQRQERLTLAMFGPWSPYLTAALGHHLSANGDSAWLLMCGRTWLPQATRTEARSRFVMAWDEASAKEVAEIIGAYQRLTDPGDDESDEAWELLTRLHNIFDTRMPTLPRPCTVSVNGEPNTDDPGDDAPDTADEAEGESAGAGEAEDGDADEGDAEGKGSGKPEQGGGSGAGSSTAPLTGPETKRRFREQLKAAVESQLEEEGSDDLDSVLDALDHGRAGDGVNGDDPMGQYDEVTDAARRLHHDVGDALLDLKDESEPGWMKRTDSGRLNVRRLVNPYVDADELFDRYEPGQMDASELELVLLVDVSGSMDRYVRDLAEAVWAIRHSVDDIEGEATVLTFDSGPHRVMASVGQRPDGRMFTPAALGGTDPSSALAEAYRILADSRARNRLMVVLTDGAWYYSARAETLIASMRAEGITTVCALMGYSAGESGHGCEHVRTIDDPMGLALLFRQVAAARIGAWR